MPSLLDIAPPEITAETVDIRGTALKVSAIDNEGWMRLHARFPELRSLVSGRPGDMSPAVVLKMNAALIAAGLGKADDAEIEHAALDRLSIVDQSQIVEVIVRLSMPGHVFGPLLNGVERHPELAAPPTVEAATK